MKTNKTKWILLGICVAIPLIVGGISAVITNDSMEAFGLLNQPPLSPPGWLFPVVWTVLFTFMGIASYLYLTAMPPMSQAPKGLLLYGLQLLFNFFWSVWFFNFGLYGFAFVWLLVLWVLILATIVQFGKVSKPAAYLLIPYLVWVTFAGYLNLGIALLN